MAFLTTQDGGPARGCHDRHGWMPRGHCTTSSCAAAGGGRSWPIARTAKASSSASGCPSLTRRGCSGSPRRGLRKRSRERSGGKSTESTTSRILPINVRLYRKGGPSHLDLGEAMIREIAGWLPSRTFALGCDGAYASLAGRCLPHTHVTSRIRKDAALYDPPPPRRKGQRGRPRKKGKRLPSPQQMARQGRTGWVRAAVEERGKVVERLLLSRPVLWYAVCPDRTVLLVIVRDPTGKQHDDFFFTTDIEASAPALAEHYAGRWSIEDTFRSVKQSLGGEDPQTWKARGPERAAALSLWLYSAVWFWYITTHGTKITWPALPWYATKRTPSFADALAALRRALWSRRIFSICAQNPLPRKMASVLLDVLAHAA